MNSQMRRCLDDLSQRIDEQEEAAVHQAWIDFVEGHNTTDPFIPPRRTPRPPQCEWPDIHINDALHDVDLMVLREFKQVSDLVAFGVNLAFNVRCNYGVSIMTSQLGCEVIEMPREQGDLPTTLALGSESDRVAAIQAAVDHGVPDLDAGQGGDVFRTAERFLEVLEQWPVLKRWVTLYHPDTQGPMDNAELAWGSDIFLAFYDTPDLVHAFIELMTEHYLAFMRRWQKLVPPDREHMPHWGMVVKGQIVLRDDSLMNLSPEIYVDFVRDREARCLRELGGGLVHFCGRGDHFIEALSAMQADGLTAINMSQPELNNMETILTHTVDRGLNVTRFDAEVAASLVASGRKLHGRLHAARDWKTG